MCFITQGHKDLLRKQIGLFEFNVNLTARLYNPIMHLHGVDLMCR